jgi:hypothetical protein
MAARTRLRHRTLLLGPLEGGRGIDHASVSPYDQSTTKYALEGKIFKPELQLWRTWF